MKIYRTTITVLTNFKPKNYRDYGEKTWEDIEDGINHGGMYLCWSDVDKDNDPENEKLFKEMKNGY